MQNCRAQRSRLASNGKIHLRMQNFRAQRIRLARLLCSFLPHPNSLHHTHQFLCCLFSVRPSILAIFSFLSSLHPLQFLGSNFSAHREVAPTLSSLLSLSNFQPERSWWGRCKRPDLRRLLGHPHSPLPLFHPPLYSSFPAPDRSRGGGAAARGLGIPPRSGTRWRWHRLPPC